MAVIIIFPYNANYFSNMNILYAIWLSNPDVGSSNMRIFGLEINYMPIASLFLYPPEILFTNYPPTNVSLHCSRFNFLRVLSTISFL